MTDVDREIRICINGVGCCAQSLVEATAAFTAKPSTKDRDRGLIHHDIGGYRVEHLKFVCGFDIDARKINLPVNQAIYQSPNCSMPLCSREEAAALECGLVYPGPILDGCSEHMLKVADKSKTFVPYGPEVTPLTKDEIVALLKSLRVDVLINYLPVGSQKATEFYIECALEAGVHVCNCIPVFIASNRIWEQKFIDRGLLCIGDDMCASLGASVLSKALESLAIVRGHRSKIHIQQNSGGNTDFLNMLERLRLEFKKISKENALRAGYEMSGGDPDEAPFVHAGPSDWVPVLGDNKIAHFHLELEGLLGSPVVIDIRMSVQDSPGSAGVVLSAVRFLKVGAEMGLVGSLRGPSAFTQKTPPTQMTIEDATRECECLSRRELTDSLRRHNVPAVVPTPTDTTLVDTVQ